MKVMLYVITTAAISKMTTTCITRFLLFSFLLLFISKPLSNYCKRIQIYIALNYINSNDFVKHRDDIFAENLLSTIVTAIQNSNIKFSCFLSRMILHITCYIKVTACRFCIPYKFSSCTCAPAHLFDGSVKEACIAEKFFICL